MPVAQAKTSMAHVVSALFECVKEVAAHTEEQTLCVIGIVTQRLEKEVEAAVVSTTAMSKRPTHLVVDGLHDEIRHI